MKLYVVQHGEAVEKELDPDRPLSEKGTRDIQLLAMYLKRTGVTASNIIHSGKKRAEQTAQIIADQLVNKNIESHATLSPNDDPTVIIAELNSNGTDLLITGHMPFISKLCSMLTAGDTNIVFGSVPGTAIFLEKKNHGWEINQMLTPSCYSGK